MSASLTLRGTASYTEKGPWSLKQVLLPLGIATGASAEDRTSRRVESAVGPTDDEPIVVTVHETAPEWLSEAVEKLNRLLALPTGWDSYGAAPVSRQAARGVLLLLSQVMDATRPKPFVVPLNDGGIQVEWHCGQSDLEVEIPASGPLALRFENPALDQEMELSGPGEVIALHLRDFLDNMK